MAQLEELAVGAVPGLFGGVASDERSAPERARIAARAGGPGEGSLRPPKVAILLCTYYGQRYLRAQLESIETQTHTNWALWASDDGSKDQTLTILKAFRSRWGDKRLFIRSGPARGFAANFLALTCTESIEADYYAYSDQDDIWESDKLARAIACLRQVQGCAPALYCSRTRLVDTDNRHSGFSPLFLKPPSFRNALMQNIGGGNTMVLNHAARALLVEAGSDVEVVTHDWWAYLVVTACGGQVIYDVYPSVRYRQHGSNLIGMNASWMARLARARMLWQGRFRKINDQHLCALQRLKGRIAPENWKTLEQFASARAKAIIPRVVELKRSGVYRQTLLGNLGLAAAAVLGRI